MKALLEAMNEDMPKDLVMQLLIHTKKKGLENNLQASYSILNVASQKGYLEIVKYMIDEYNTPSYIKRFHPHSISPIESASANGDLEMVMLLHDHFAKNKDGGKRELQQALENAVKNKHFEIVRHFLQTDMKMDEKSLTSLFLKASIEGDIQIFDYILSTYSAKFPINLNDIGADLLINASSNQHIELVKYLLDKGVNINARNKRDCNAIEYQFYGFIDKDCFEMMKFLLENGAEFNEHKSIYEKFIKRTYVNLLEFEQSKSELPIEKQKYFGYHQKIIDLTEAYKNHFKKIAQLQLYLKLAKLFHNLEFISITILFEKILHPYSKNFFNFFSPLNDLIPTLPKLHYTKILISTTEQYNLISYLKTPSSSVLIPHYPIERTENFLQNLQNLQNL